MVIGDYQPKTEKTGWDELIDNVLGPPEAQERRAYQARVYSSMMHGDTVERKLRSIPFHKSDKPALFLDTERARSFLMASKGFGSNLLLSQEIRLRAYMTNKLNSRWKATAPASSAERSWAGYRLQVRRFTKEERAARRELRWMHGYWGANARTLPNYSKVWSNWTQVHSDWPELTKRFYGIDK